MKRKVVKQVIFSPFIWNCCHFLSALTPPTSPLLKLRSGSSVPLASIVVTDQSGLELKVALWRRAAFWVLTVCPGDVLLITGESSIPKHPLCHHWTTTRVLPALEAPGYTQNQLR